MFVIEVKQEERDEDLDYGYGRIKEYSKYLKE